MKNVTRFPEHDALILSKVDATDKKQCWIWKGQLNYNKRPVQQFRNNHKFNPYNVLIKQYMYQKAFNVELTEQVKFHFCPLDERCVNPTHNRPEPNCTCPTCATHYSTGRYGLRPITLHRLSFESGEGDTFTEIFTTELKAVRYAVAYLSQRYGKNFVELQNSAGFQWSITKFEANPVIEVVKDE